MTDRTEEVIKALAPHTSLIQGAIALRMKEELTEERGLARSEQAVRAFVKNNASTLGLGDAKRLCVCWEKVVDHFRAVA